jgi:hypothetical protein
VAQLVLPLPVIVVANVAVGKPWASHATAVLCGLTAGATFLLGLVIFVGAMAPASSGFSQQPLGASLMAVGGAAAVATWPPGLRRLARFIPIDPEDPVHAIALALAVVIIGTQFAFGLFVDELGSFQATPALTIADLLGQQLPLLVVAAIGVGLYIRRGTRETVSRLGWVRPAWWHIVLGLAAAGVFLAVSVAMGALSDALTPELSRRIQSTTDHLFGGLVGNPLSVLAIALLPGICEETIFRGALQPRLGLILTAILFASIHTQYSISIDTLTVLILGLGLGLIRKYTNTTTSAITHATYNLITGIGIGGLALGIAGVVEVGLIVVSAYAIWSNRRPAPTAGP